MLPHNQKDRLTHKLISVWSVLSVVIILYVV